VNAASGADVVLGILPGGGGNDFADALGLPGDGAAAARAILTGEPRCVDLARARTADGRERLYLGGGGLGVDAEAARHASGALRHLPGKARYIASALRALWRYRPPKVRAEFPQSALPPLEMNALLAAVLNTPSYGAGIRLAPEARVDDGWLDFAMVEERSLLSALGLLPGLLRSGELHTTRMQRVRAQRIRLITWPECLFHGDGEILGPTPVEIEVAPRAARVLAPVPR
jgi:diacylglycerol kinase (ATP)